MMIKVLKTVGRFKPRALFATAILLVRSTSSPTTGSVKGLTLFVRVINPIQPETGCWSWASCCGADCVEDADDEDEGTDDGVEERGQHQHSPNCNAAEVMKKIRTTKPEVTAVTENPLQHVGWLDMLRPHSIKHAASLPGLLSRQRPAARRPRCRHRRSNMPLPLSSPMITTRYAVDFGDDHPFNRDLAGDGMSVRRWRQDRIYIRLSGDRLTKNGWDARQMLGRCVMACSCTAAE